MNRTASRAGIGVLDWVLLAAAVFVFVVAVLVPVLGPSGLGWISAETCGREVCGDFQSIRAELLGQTNQEMYDNLPSTGGVYDFSGPLEAQVAVYDNWSQGPVALLLAGRVLKGLLAVGVLLALLVILRRLRDGDLFVRRNASVVFLIAGLIAVGGEFSALLTYWGTREVLTHPGIGQYVWQDVPLPVLPLVYGLVVAAGAEIFRRGAVMREDVEGLV